MAGGGMLISIWKYCWKFTSTITLKMYILCGWVCLHSDSMLKFNDPIGCLRVLNDANTCIYFLLEDDDQRDELSQSRERRD